MKNKAFHKWQTNLHTQRKERSLEDTVNSRILIPKLSVVSNLINHRMINMLEETQTELFWQILRNYLLMVSTLILYQLVTKVWSTLREDGHQRSIQLNQISKPSISKRCTRIQPSVSPQLPKKWLKTQSDVLCKTIRLIYLRSTLLENRLRILLRPLQQRHKWSLKIQTKSRDQLLKWSGILKPLSLE